MTIKKRVRIKICGIRTTDIAKLAVSSGADALGFVFYKKSPRFIDPLDAGNIISELPPFIGLTGVFADLSAGEIESAVKKSGINTIQLQGEKDFYPPEIVREIKTHTGLPVIMAVRTEIIDEKFIKELVNQEYYYEKSVSAFLIDKYDINLYGGTGIRLDIDSNLSGSARKFLSAKVILAGGLNVSNVTEIIREIMPYGIDISSGIEKLPGVKDPMMLEEFIKKALLA